MLGRGVDNGPGVHVREGRVLPLTRSARFPAEAPAELAASCHLSPIWAQLRPTRQRPAEPAEPG